MQFYPEASRPEAAVHPGLYRPPRRMRGPVHPRRPRLRVSARRNPKGLANPGGRDVAVSNFQFPISNCRRLTPTCRLPRTGASLRQLEIGNHHGAARGGSASTSAATRPCTPLRPSVCGSSRPGRSRRKKGIQTKWPSKLPAFRARSKSYQFVSPSWNVAHVRVQPLPGSAVRAGSRVMAVSLIPTARRYSPSRPTRKYPTARSPRTPGCRGPVPRRSTAGPGR